MTLFFKIIPRLPEFRRIFHNVADIYRCLKLFSHELTFLLLVVLSQEMDFDRVHLRHILLHEFRLGHAAAETLANVCRAEGQGAVSLTTVKRWFRRFRSGDFSLADVPRSGRPVEVDEGRLLMLLEEDSRQTARSLAELLESSKSTVHNHLRQLGKVPKLGLWVPHQLTPQNLRDRAEACTILLSISRRLDWLDNVITGDETWCLYCNHTRKHQWIDVSSEPEPEPKPGLHKKKVMVSVWWSVHGIELFELLPNNITVTSALYAAQLDRLNAALQRRRPQQNKVYILHDNARPHVAKMTRNKLIELGWEQLPHPPYSPDIAPSDYWLFRSLKHYIKEKKFDDRKSLESDLKRFFASQPASFYRDGIHSLAQRWREVVEYDGQYISD